MKVSGTMIVHNGIEGDYCFRESVRSMLAVCDEVVALDADSTDGTMQALVDMASEDSKLNIVSAAWQSSPMGKWLSDLTNSARLHCRFDWHLNLQADEVIDPSAAEEIRKSAWLRQGLCMPRLNFWGDHRHVLPNGVCVSSWVYRFAPTRVPSVGDAESLNPVGSKYQPSKCRIFHYGFIRKAAGFVAKSIPMQEAFFGTHDPLIDRVPAEGMKVLLESHPMHELLPFSGEHPKVAHDWLKERGYEP